MSSRKANKPRPHHHYNWKLFISHDLMDSLIQAIPAEARASSDESAHSTVGRKRKSNKVTAGEAIDRNTGKLAKTFDSFNNQIHEQTLIKKKDCQTRITESLQRNVTELLKERNRVLENCGYDEENAAYKETDRLYRKASSKLEEHDVSI